MGRDKFLRELEFLLSDVSPEEREAALLYYRDYFDEAGPEREREVLEHIGSPEKVAAELKNSLNGDTEGGEYTEHGYYDERFDEKHRVPDAYGGIVKREGQRQNEETNKEKGKGNKGRNVLLLILLCFFFGIPLATSIISAGFSVIAAIIGGLVGIFAGLIGLIIGGVAAVAGLLIGGIVMVINGAVNMWQLPVGLMGICLGLLMISGAMLIAALTKWGCTTAVPGLFRFCTGAVKGCCRWIRNIVCRLFGRGGEAG
ncbi:MAG TPA: DUF1700 domain-containing protein [Candidatus Choladousia intestinipullorum]|nr:DUF1700 domain-containing protein [Candidatus Choladousia intestinipullorum]